MLLHTRHINVNDDGYLWKIYSQREGCVSSTKQKRTNDSDNELFNEIFGKPYYKKYTKCPGKNSTHVLLNQLCDGFNNCKQKPSERSEEEACNYEAGNKTVFSNKTYIRRMPACLPGIFHQGKCEKLEKAMGFITNPTLILETNQSYHCEATWGMIYSLLKCFNRCHDSSTTECPLKVLSTKCYNNQQYSMAVDPNDTKGVHYVYHDGMDYISMFQCEASDTCIHMDKFCDNYKDCDDMSDMNCDNYISCNDNSSKYDKRLKCDGVYDCKDKSDECNEFCSDSILRELWMKTATVVIGVSAIAINMVSLAMFLLSLNQSKSLSSVINDTLVALISLGDLIVGIYMLCLFIADVTNTKYCAEKYKWLGSIECNALGVMSTFGSNLSLLSMTALSIFRIVSLKIMLVFSEKNKKTILLLIALVVIIVFWSLSMSLMPTLNYFEDYFVNGIYYHVNPVFRGSTTRSNFFNALKIWNIASNENSPWKSWKDDANRIFNNETQELSIGFYGNDGVCLFKYFVTTEDPQWKFSIFLLAQNLVCFIVITICYSMIILHTLDSSKGAGNEISPSIVRLQRKVSIIIATDFATWIPFITLAFYYFLRGGFKSDSIYSICSIIFLPINSVLNPIIYNGDAVIGKFRQLLQNAVQSTFEVSVGGNSKSFEGAKTVRKT